MPVTKSRLGLARPAMRPAMWGRVMLAAPSGAGKTWTALALAETLVPPTSRILGIDTEKSSMLTYADEFVRPDGSPIFEHLPWSPPFDARELTDTLRAAGDVYDAVIVDSLSHFWQGTGGILDVAAGRFTGWKEARPMQADLVEAILHCDAHVILCVREKQAHVQTQDADGKWRVEKLGMEAIQDATLEYEMNVSIQIDMQHALQVSKSRTRAVPVGTMFHAGHAQDFAVLYRDWLAAGEPVAPVSAVSNLVAALDGIDIDAERLKAKRAFLDEFGRPEMLLQSRLDEAAAWVADVVLAANGGAVTGAATDGADEAPDADPSDPGPDDTDETSTSPPTAAAAASPAPEAPNAAGNGAANPETATQDVSEVREGIEVSVKAMAVAQVVQALRKAGLSDEGTPPAKRKRLVDHLVERATASVEA